MPNKRIDLEKVIIVGGGPAGLMAAQSYAERGYEVAVYDHKVAMGRKFLVAGHGGFNLTHSKPLPEFLEMYEGKEIQTIVTHFDNQSTIKWLTSIGIDTFVGSSGKIFPVEGIKPIMVLNAWTKYLKSLGVTFHLGNRLIDFDAESLSFQSSDDSTLKLAYHRAVFAFGGASWKQTGSDGTWSELFEKKSILLKPFTASNCGLNIENNDVSLSGQPLKNVVVSDGKGHQKMGEVVFTDYGIEGAPIYYLNRFIRKNEFPQRIFIDLKPTWDFNKLVEYLGKGNITKVLKEKINLKGVALQLLKKLSKDDFTNPRTLAQSIKAYPILVSGLRPIDEAISTYGGLAWEALNEDLSLKSYPNIQCCGEMLDWDAPTGGYLLQACFASGYYCGITSK